MPYEFHANVKLRKQGTDDDDAATRKYVDDSVAGGGLPTGGDQGDLLAKKTVTDYDVEWIAAPTGGGAAPSDATPTMNGTAAAGTATTVSRGDHIHPTDTSRAAQSALDTLQTQVNGIENLGHYVGAFNTRALVPSNASGFIRITANDFISVRADETQNGATTRYVASHVAGDGTITWAYDITYSTDVSGKMALVSGATTNHLAAFDSAGQVVDLGILIPDGGALSEVLAKKSATDYDFEWIAAAAGAATSDQVKTGQTLTVSHAVGGWMAGQTISITDSVWDVIKRLLNPRVAPSYVAPNLTLSGTTPLAREIGESITPTLTPNWQQNDGGSISQYRLKKDGTTIYTAATAIAHNDTTFTLAANVSYQAEADFAQGPIKNDSEGDPDPTGQIAAGTRQSTTVTYTPGRRAFSGPLADATVPATSAFIRGLVPGVLNPGNGTTLTADVVQGNRGVSFAYPASLRAVTSITQQTLGSQDLKAGFTQATISVEGAGGYTPIDYRVYYIINAVGFPGADRFTLTI